jgi:hypothetical protein
VLVVLAYQVLFLETKVATLFLVQLLQLVVVAVALLAWRGELAVLVVAGEVLFQAQVEPQGQEQQIKDLLVGQVLPLLAVVAVAVVLVRWLLLRQVAQLTQEQMVVKEISPTLRGLLPNEQVAVVLVEMV